MSINKSGLTRIGYIINYTTYLDDLKFLTGFDKIDYITLNTLIDEQIDTMTFTSFNYPEEFLSTPTYSCDVIIFKTDLLSKKGYAISIALLKFLNGDRIAYKITCFEGEFSAEIIKATDSSYFSESIKNDIYNLLCSNFNFNEQEPMAKISLFLTQHNYNAKDYGFEKMKFLFEKLDFLKLDEVNINSIPSIMVTLLEKPERKNSEKNLLSIENRSGISVPDSTIQYIRKFFDDGIPLDDDEIRKCVRESFELSRQDNSLEKTTDGFSFELVFNNEDFNNMLYLTIKPDSFSGNGWYANFVGEINSTDPSSALFDFASCGQWEETLKSLAALALTENWSLGENNNYILSQYLKYTFYRLQLEDKVLSNEYCAAFNTGLVDKHYEDIYAYFSPSNNSKQKFKFEDFCVAGKKGFGKNLIKMFNPLPPPASYVKKKDDLLFNLDKELYTDFDHIILENTQRLPIEFLKEELSKDNECSDIIDKIIKEKKTSDINYQHENQLFKNLTEIIEDNPRLYNNLKNRISDAIELSKKKIRWNYKTALPSYFPTRNTMSLMLPLCLLSDDTVDVALVAELLASGNYQGQTILTLKQAYIDSRLICRPNSEWLNPDIFSTKNYDFV